MHTIEVSGNTCSKETSRSYSEGTAKINYGQLMNKQSSKEGGLVIRTHTGDCTAM